MARRVAQSLVARFVAQCVGDEVESDRALTSTSDPVAYRWSVIDVPALEHALGPRLWVSDEVIARWMTGDMPVELAVEEVHTAALPVRGRMRNWSASLRTGICSMRSPWLIECASARRSSTRSLP